MGDGQSQDAVESAPRWHRLPGGIGLICVTILGGLLSWHSLTDLDIWFHLRAGRELLAGGGFPQINTYSFATPNHPWLNHEWLFQVFVAWIGPDSSLDGNTALGWNILRAALAMILVTTLILGDGVLGRVRRGNSVGSVLVACGACIAGLMLIWPRLNLRPELVSYLLFILVVRKVEKYYRQNQLPPLRSDRQLGVILALIVLWAQCHGFAALGPVILFFGALFRWLESSKSPQRWTARSLWTPVGLGIISLLLTPNHWHGLVFPFRALTQLSQETADLTTTVSELVPLLSTTNSLGLTLTVFKLSLLWSALFVVVAWRRISLLRVALLVLSIWAAFSNQRNIAFYGLTFVLLHTGTEGQLLRKLPAWRWRAALPRPYLSVLAVVATGLLCVITGWWAQSLVTNDFYLREGVGRRFGSGLTPATYPHAAAKALTTAQGQRAFANLDAAAYLLGTTDAKLLIDGRTEAFPKTSWSEYNALRDGGVQAVQRLQDRNISAAIVATASGAFSGLVAELMASPAWHPAAADEGGILFVPHVGPTPTPQTNPLPAAASRVLRREERDVTRRADLCLAAANLLLTVGDESGALRAIQLGLQARPDHPQLNHNLGNQLLNQGEFAQALPHFLRAFDMNGRLAGSALNAGVCQLRLNQTEAAITSFRRSLAIDSNQVGAWVNLAVALRGSGQNGAALSALENAVALQPGDARLQGQLRAWRQGRP